jgi:hypothetical protein
VTVATASLPTAQPLRTFNGSSIDYQVTGSKIEGQDANGCTLSLTLDALENDVKPATGTDSCVPGTLTSSAS